MTSATGSREPFSAFMERALYDSETGFYATHRAGGARGDFITSVEVGPLFAALVGERLDRAWSAMGRPDPFRVAELGAGVGTLWRGIRKAAPKCLAALDYHLIEISDVQRLGHGDLVGPRVHSGAALPEQSVHVIFGNEVLDNVPFDIVEVGEQGWHEVQVVTDAAGQRSFAVGDLVDWNMSHHGLATGQRVPRIDVAVELVEICRRKAQLTILIDYAASTAELAGRGQNGWLRTYRGHESGADPLGAPGTCDITCDVPIDQLPPPSLLESQVDWLVELGISARVAAARRQWSERAGVGDLAAMFARSAISEAEALLAQPGLGTFTVMEWE